MSAAAVVAGWDNFYVIVGSAASGLTGLTFVVVALAADANMARLPGLKIFVSPTVIHFSSALWIALLAALPHPTRLSLGLSMLVSGLVGALYTLRTMIRMRRMDRNDYVPVLEDWLWNGALPEGSYLLLAVGGTLTGASPSLAGYLIGLAALLLLFIGIHNAWDLAVWILAERPSRRRKMEAASEEQRRTGAEQTRTGG